jgi:hypothetical protein
VENQLVVSLPPVVADAVVLVDGDGLNAQHLKSGSGGQASLASTWRNVSMESLVKSM